MKLNDVCLFVSTILHSEYITLGKEFALFGVSDRFHCSTKYNLYIEKQVQSTIDSLKN